MSTTKKDDLTRIEDLGEYLHEMNEEDTLSFDNESSEITTDLDSDLNSEFNPEFTQKGQDFPPDFNSETDFNSDFQTENDFENSVTENWQESSSEEFTGDSLEEGPEFNSDFLFQTLDPSPSSEEEKVQINNLIKNEQDLPPLDLPRPLETSLQEARETFEEVKSFAESTTMSSLPTEANPAFSVLLKQVKYDEEAQDIVSILKELGLLQDTEGKILERLSRGSLLIPRISEFAAITLAHKVRRFDIDIQVGPSDLLHPSKHQESPEVGLISKRHLYQNHSHHFRFDQTGLDYSQILVATTSHIEGYEVIRYLGVATEQTTIDSLQDEDREDLPISYQDLAQKLKAHALRAHANAILGLQYQLLPLPAEEIGNNKYRLICTGTLAWVNKL